MASAPPFKTVYNPFTDNSYGAAEPSATDCGPQAAPQGDLHSQGLDYVAEIPEISNDVDPSTFLGVNSYLGQFDLSQLHTPKPTHPPRMPTQKHKYHPYLSPPLVAPPVAIAPGVRLMPAAFPACHPALYNGFSGIRPQDLLMPNPAGGTSDWYPPFWNATNYGNDDLPWQPAAAISAPVMATPFPELPTPSPISNGWPPSLTATPATPPGAAGDVQEGGSGEAEPQSDIAEVTNPANSATIDVHSQRNAESGVATTVGSVVFPFPAHRENILDLLQGGLHVQCIMPSVRYNEKRIVCLGEHKLQDDGSFVQGRVCGKVCASEDAYGRHVKVVHMGMDRKRASGSLNIRQWIRRARPNANVLRGDPNLVVQEARAKNTDVRIRKRSNRERKETPSD